MLRQRERSVRVDRVLDRRVLDRADPIGRRACEWIEPVGWLCVDEDDRKFAVWTEQDCELIHPDDVRIYDKRYQAWLESQQMAANALVSSRRCALHRSSAI